MSRKIESRAWIAALALLAIASTTAAQDDFRSPYNFRQPGRLNRNMFGDRYRYDNTVSPDGVPPTPDEGGELTPEGTEQPTPTPQNVEQQWRTYLDANPCNEDAIATLVGLMYQQGRRTEAVRFLERQISCGCGTLKLRLLLAQLYLDLGCSCTAQTYMESVFDCYGYEPDVTFYLGTAYLQNDYPIAAYRTLLCGPNSTMDIEHSRQLSMAAALAQVGLYDHAYDIIAEVNRCSGDPAIRQSACELHRQLDEALYETNRFYGSLRYGLRYDSNPAVVPTTNIFGTVADPTPSLGSSYMGSFNYEIFRGEATTTTIGYNILGTTNYRNSAADLLDNAVYLQSYRRLLVGDTPTFLGARFDYDYLDVGSDPYLQRFGFNPTVTVLDTDLITTLYQFRYTRFDFKRQNAFENTVFDADSDNYLLGITRQWEFPVKRLFLSGGYLYDYNASQGGNFDYNGHQLQLGLIYQIPGTDYMQINASGTTYFRGYVNDDATFGYKRDDVEYLANVSLLYEFADDWYASLGYTLDRNDSNLPTSDYIRHMVELGVQYNFPPGAQQNRLLMPRRGE
jgi:hypothetical protein